MKVPAVNCIGARWDAGIGAEQHECASLSASTRSHVQVDDSSWRAIANVNLLHTSNKQVLRHDRDGADCLSNKPWGSASQLKQEIATGSGWQLTR